MIVFELKCANGHVFEGWFDDSAAFEEQSRKGQVACPVCDVNRITRIPSGFALKAKADSSAPEESVPEGQIAELASRLTEYVEKNFANVGSEFAKEALKMHYGVTEARNIRGTSTDAEEKMLREEGIAYFKLPLPDPPSQDET